MSEISFILRIHLTTKVTRILRQRLKMQSEGVAWRPVLRIFQANSAEKFLVPLPDRPSEISEIGNLRFP